MSVFDNPESFYNETRKYPYAFRKRDNMLILIDEAVEEEEYFVKSQTCNDTFEVILVKESNRARRYFRFKTKPEKSVFLKHFPRDTTRHDSFVHDIVVNKGFFDTIFNKELKFHKAVPEKWQDVKRPDVSFYDENDNLVLCLEVFNTNKKTKDDIDELKKIGVPVTEIDINEINKNGKFRCKHIVLPTILEANRQRTRDIEIEINRAEEQNRNLKREYERYSTEITKNEGFRIAKIKKEIHNKEVEYEEWIERTIKRRLPEIYRVNGKIHRIRQKIQSSSVRLKELSAQNRVDYDEIKRRIRYFRDGIHKLKKTEIEFRKHKNEIERIELEIRDRKRNTEAVIKEIGAKKILQSVRNEFISYIPENIIDEIRYWLT